tara:strand:- start:154 stop:849 length:696 start_codon:yes stop_codon:yes gene_type:complete
MADITFSHTFPSGAPTDASNFSKNLYDPSLSPDSFDVINGFLDNDNREAGWDIDHTHVRSLDMASGRMVGATANADYLASLFPVEVDSVLYKEMIPIAGASISFYCPRVVEVGIFTWQLMLSNDSMVDSANTLHPSVMLFVDGVHKKETYRTFPGSMDRASASVKRPYRDRLYSGHYTMAKMDNETLSAGWHTASLRLVMPGDTSILSSSYTARNPLTRLRVRNMKVFWLA